MDANSLGNFVVALLLAAGAVCFGLGALVVWVL